MPHKGPHISIDSASLVNRILRINMDDFEDWPEGVRQLTIEIAEELFLVRYNPFVNPLTVRKSVDERFEQSRRALAHHYANSISEGITMFWSAHESDQVFRKEIIGRLSEILPKESIDLRASSRVENATDATDLRLELPLLVITPGTAEEVSAVVRLANEMQFALIPRGGGSGLTGGAIPARKRTVILSLTRLTKISPVDKDAATLTAEAGVLTSDAIAAASAAGLLFSVDPASNTASSIGGNVAENSGGPLAFEYGTAVDNLLSYRMVTPTGEIIEIIRKDHPRHKIMEEETAVFEVRDLSGGVRNVVRLKGSELRAPGLGKDVTNKALNGLPGVQKEGVDGVVLEATFILHPVLKHSQVLVLEFYGRSMHNATLAIRDVVEMRDLIRRRGDLVKISALEEFNSKYVQAIEYRKKSGTYEGDPISVLILQLDSNSTEALEACSKRVVDICRAYEGVDVFVAKDEKEAEHFWEDRHRLSAIAKRTSGFKINEDVVLPMRAIPEFAVFLEQLNVECMGRAFRKALQEVGRLQGMADDDKEFNREFTYASRIVKGEIPTSELSDQELQLHAVLYLNTLRETYPHLAKKINKIEEYMLSSHVIVASHMHAGDGNWHVNIPVNSNDPEMLEEAEKAAARVMRMAQDLGGEVTGEHGVGITKIAFLSEAKMQALREFKELVDPRNIMNPAKLTQRELPVSSFTFSFNRLITDLSQSGLPNKERLIELLLNVQSCTRCGKCKSVCGMHYPEAGMQYYPRNRNIALGALIEAVYYSQVNGGEPEERLLEELRGMMEHCTGCGRCTSVCPVKINSPEVALNLRAMLEEDGKAGHPVKSRALSFISKNLGKRAPQAAKLAAFGQNFQNRLLKITPPALRKGFENPLFSGFGPGTGFKNLAESINLERGCIFNPEGVDKGTVLYFPGCGGSLFFRSIGLAGLMLCLRAGWRVILPPQHMCCGYPLLAAGMQEAFALNQDANIRRLQAICAQSAAQGHPVSHVLTACGSCRDGLERHFLPTVIAGANAASVPDGVKAPEKVQQLDMVQFLLNELTPLAGHSPLPGAPTRLVYHSPCHAEWSGVPKTKAGGLYGKAIAGFTGLKVTVAPGCCGESGMGAMTSPKIYNRLRARKVERLRKALADLPESSPIIVGCPSCKIGISRIMLNHLDKKRPVLHSLEFLAEGFFGADWRARCRKLAQRSQSDANGVREIDLAQLSGVKVEQAEKEADE